MSIYTIKINHPDNNDFQLLGVVTKHGLDNCSEDKYEWGYLGNILNRPRGSQYRGIPESLLAYKNVTFDHSPWLVPEETYDESTRFSTVSELSSLEKIEVRLLSAKLTRSFSGDTFTASLPPTHPLRDCIVPYRTGIYIFENDILIWKGEVSKTVKKLSGEVTITAVGITDIINYFCPIKQTFHNQTIRSIIYSLIWQYNGTVSDARRVYIDPKIYEADDLGVITVGEYTCDGATPLLKIIKELTFVNQHDSGHWFGVMVDLDPVYSFMDFRNNLHVDRATRIPPSFFESFYASAGKIPMITYGYTHNMPRLDENGYTIEPKSLFSISNGERRILRTNAAIDKV